MIDLLATTTVSIIIATSSFLGSNFVTATSTVRSVASDLYACKQLITADTSLDSTFYKRFYTKVRMLLL